MKQTDRAKHFNTMEHTSLYHIPGVWMLIRQIHHEFFSGDQPHSFTPLQGMLATDCRQFNECRVMKMTRLHQRHVGQQMEWKEDVDVML